MHQHTLALVVTQVLDGSIQLGTVFNLVRVNTVSCMFSAALSLKSANYYVNKFLSASAWYSLSSLVIFFPESTDF